MNKIFLLLLLVACGVQAQIGGSPTGFNYGIKLPNATNEGDTLTVDTKIPIMNNNQVVNYFANVSDILAMGMSGLTPNRALISDGSGDLAVSAVTTTELSYVSGVTSALQTQLNSKLDSSTYTSDWSGLNSSNFLRSGAQANKTSGNLIMNDGISLVFGTSTRSRITNAGGDTFWLLFNGDLVVRDDTTPRFTFSRTTGNLTATGTVTATNFILSSDKRLKENFIDLGNGYYSFNFKGSKEKRYGVIAQEVKEYAPELVSEDEDGYLKVAYIDLLIKKQAEQEKRITYLWIVIGVLSLGVGYSILKK